MHDQDFLADSLLVFLMRMGLKWTEERSVSSPLIHPGLSFVEESSGSAMVASSWPGSMIRGASKKARLVTADLKSMSSPFYKITPDEFYPNYISFAAVLEAESAFLVLLFFTAKVHTQQYQKQQGNSTAILTRSCKFGMFDPQGRALLIDRQQHFCVARFCSTTIDPDTSSIDRYSLTTVDRQNHLPSTNIFHLTSIDTPSQTSIDTEPREMLAPLILVRDNNGDLHDQEGHLRNAAVLSRTRITQLEHPTVVVVISLLAHAQQYKKQQGNSTAILTRSCKFGTFDPQGSTLLIDLQQHLCVAQFCSTTVDPDTSSLDRYSLTTVDRQHSPSVEQHLSSDIDRYSIPYIDRY
ncbi:hypothetical protein DY000_02014305 [Brassica cretica]|uniref:Uncharacterized protein n=1 Tax=Brassica cretica TaxID=69181 RepID=A0ABQ7CPZ5_BRACR|nr:hypothetical protein DY000_02014305 [Brassica cretica]